MYGYINIYAPELKPKDKYYTVSVYCTLCETLSKNYGVLSRLFTCYESAFLGVILLALKDASIFVKKHPCAFQCYALCSVCCKEKSIVYYKNDKGDEEIFNFISAVSVLLLHYKLEDTILDMKVSSSKLLNFFKKILKASKKAKKIYPELDKIFIECMESQALVENSKSADIYQCAEPFAVAFSKIFSMKVEDVQQKKNMSDLGYHLGSWIYILDAIDDIERDKKEKNFNSFVEMEKLGKINCGSENFKLYSNDLLNENLKQINLAYNKLKIYKFFGTIENILNYGMLALKRKILERLETVSDSSSRNRS
jgi:hypothetical protein